MHRPHLLTIPTVLGGEGAAVFLPDRGDDEHVGALGALAACAAPARDASQGESMKAAPMLPAMTRHLDSVAAAPGMLHATMPDHEQRVHALMAAMQQPRLAERLVDDLEKWCRKHGVSSLTELRGSLTWEN